MSDNNEIIGNNNYKLLDIFSEEDKNGHDTLAMSDFLNVSMGKIEEEIGLETTWDICNNIEPFIGEITATLESGYDISEMGMLVADHSHFGKEVIDGLKSGIYHVGQSKEVNGNLRPAILDADEHLVKFFTLKKAINPTKILSDISELSMQASLRNISEQIGDIDRNVQYEIDLQRREQLNTKFIDAREKIKKAAYNSDNKREEYLERADEYLTEGLNSLYGDLIHQITSLSKLNLSATLKTVDQLLKYINEDMQMIPRYVGMRVYLFNYRGMYDLAQNVLDEYQYQIQDLNNKKYKNSKYTAFELIHEYYPYNDENKDFWIKMPKQLLESIGSYKTMLEQNNKDVFYIDAEDETDE